MIQKSEEIIIMNAYGKLEAHNNPEFTEHLKTLTLPMRIYLTRRKSLHFQKDMTVCPKM